MNMYHMCVGCGNVFEVDRVAEKQRYDYERTFRCPIPSNPRCRGTVKWLKEEDARKVPKTIGSVCSQCHNEYTNLWLAESTTEGNCTHCHQRTQIAWVTRGGNIALSRLWLVIGILILVALLCYKLCRQNGV
jgi:hypothetical protein